MLQKQNKLIVLCNHATLLLCLVFSLAISGCGHSHHSGGTDGGSLSGGGTSNYVSVFFHFQNYDKTSGQPGGVMPAGTTEVRFSGFSVDGSLAYGSASFKPAETIDLIDVPVSVSDFIVEYLDAQGQVLAFIHKTAAITPGRNLHITVTDYEELTQYITAFSINPASAVLVPGYSANFTVSALLKDGYLANLSASSTWVVANTDIALVSVNKAEASVKAVEVGNTKLQATYAGLSAEAALKVEHGQVSYIEVNPNSRTVAVGEKVQLKAYGIFSNGQRVDITNEVTWDSSAATVATVNDEGLVEALADGTANITCLDAASGVTAQAQISVSNSLQLVKVTLRCLQNNSYVAVGAMDAYVGTRFYLQALGTFSDGSERDVTNFANWQVGDTSKVAAVGSTGAFNTLAKSSLPVHINIASISSTIPHGTITYDNNDLAVTINGALLERVEFVSTSTWDAPSGGYIRKLQAIGHYSDGSQQDISSSVTWNVEDPDHTGLTVSNTAPDFGTVTTGSTPGTAQVYGTVTNASGTVITSDKYSFITGNAIVKSLLISHDDNSTDPVTLARGLTKQFKATAVLSDDSTEDATNLVHWSTSANMVPQTATPGLYKAVAEGTAKISADYINSEAIKATSNEISVEVGSPTVVSLRIAPTRVVLTTNETRQLTAYAKLTDNSEIEVTESAAWSCDPVAKATVVKGLVTAKQETATDSPAAISAVYQGVSSRDSDSDAELNVSSMYKLAVDNVNYSGVSGLITADVVCLDADNNEYTCPGTIVVPTTSEGGLTSLNVEIFVNMATTDKVKSITFYNTPTGMHRKYAFEWWDVASGVPYTKDFCVDIVNNEFAGGDGSDSNPYLVANLRQLDNIRNGNNNTKAFRQTKNLVFGNTGALGDNTGNSTGLSGVVNDSDYTASFLTENVNARFYNEGKGWEPIPNFMGSYDGANLTIDGLYINRPTTDGVGLLADVDKRAVGGTGMAIANLSIGEHALVVGQNNVGTLCGKYALSDITATEQVKRSMENLKNRGNIVGQANVGGLIGNFSIEGVKNISMDLLNCCNYGTVVAESDNVGGVIGSLALKNNGKDTISINSTTNEGRVIAKASSAGGIVGLLQAEDSAIKVSGCVNKNQVFSYFPDANPTKAINNIGGIVGIVQRMV